MKILSLLSVLLFVAGCATSVTPSRAPTTVSTVETKPGTFVKTVTYGPDYGAGSAAFSRAPGLYQTSAGFPHLIEHSSNLKNGRGPLVGGAALRRASSFSRAQYRAPYLKAFNAPAGKGEMRVSTVDGVSFLMVVSPRPREVLKSLFGHQPYRDLADDAVRLSGCTRTGETVVEVRGGVTRKLIVPVDC